MPGQRSHDQFATILRGITDGITVEDASGRLLYANDAAARILGYASADELMATPVDKVVAAFELFDENGQPIDRAALADRQALAGIEAEQTVGFRPVASGEMRWSVLHSMPALDGSGQAINVFRDITERRQIAVERERLLQKAEQAVRDREQLMAWVSHDLRNPLSTIGMATELLLRSAAPESLDKALRAASNVQRAVARMERLIHDLLDLARIEGGGLPLERGDHDLAQLVAEAIELHAGTAAEKGLTLINEARSPSPTSCDRERVLQIFSNLVDNALKFTPPGGSVRVGAERKGGEVIAWVADDGPGVPEAQRSRIFERYRQVHLDQRGVGLGLAIARGVIEAHGGRIWVEGPPGARFCLALPSAAAASVG